MDDIKKVGVSGLGCRILRNGVGRLAAALFFFFLAVCQFGCAPAKIENIIIENRVAGPGEYHVVQITREKKALAAETAMPLKSGDEIRTDSQSTAVISFLDGMTVVAEVLVKPNTHVKILNPELKLSVMLGEVYAWIMEKGKFALQFEYVNVAEHGTELYARVNQDQDVSIVVIDGSITLESRTQRWSPMTVYQFQQGSVSGEKKPEVKMAGREQINDIIQEVNSVERLIKGDMPRFLVPDLTGLSEEEAFRVLGNARLKAGMTRRVITRQGPVGTVVGQEPEAGTRLSPQSSILIDVEAEPVSVPDLRGFPRGQAEQLTIRSGLSVGRVQEDITGSRPKDTILRQNPPAGRIVPKGSAVDLWIEADSVVVPDLTRLHIHDARLHLERARLRPGRVHEKITGRAEPNTILGQYPPPGTRMRPGSEVVMDMEMESAVVPDVQRRHINQATTLLKAANLNFRNVREDVTGTAPYGTVLEQAPRPGARVPLHSLVDLVIEAESVVVPHVIGRPSNEAMILVQRERLRPFVQMEYTGRQTRDVVFMQTPGAGTRVRPGSSVTLSVEGAYFIMPHVLSLRIEQAKRLFMERGIGRVQIDYRETRNHQPGTVMEQHPRPGAPVRSLGELRLVVAKEQRCMVPYVLGQTVRDAMRIVRQAGLVPQLDCRGGDSGGCDPVHGQKVLSQNPAPGSPAPCGSHVVLTYSGRIG